ncbi:ABC transporter permease [Marinobacterium sediminicola]|uniref:ABC transport system permease protein n=1 Tax=Marinobacterium sediminicola TaxID=518898 RepID=A0ABY1RWM9_9GAMM|nr:FtsX-like permease family protein [Marinobacterium sediminicola]ULG70281.1 ABC transporter permease [Marinobacterium sediminicola]SMR69867.1 putative ABC transport system permease protein [Marinobacterium sediminicola]
MLIRLAWNSLQSRRTSVLLTLFTITLSTALLLGVQQIREQSRQNFMATVAGTDLIVGARSGPVQLLLYSLFHIGSATSNMDWSSYESLTNDARVEWTIPLSLGDSHRGYRVIGTHNSLFQHYRFADQQALAFTAGGPFDDLFSIVIGAEVARKLGYQPGDPVIIAHGSGNTSFMKHTQMPFSVSGILAPTGTPLDRTLMVSLEGLEAVHLGWRAGVPLPGLQISPERARQRDLTPTEVTAVLVGLKSRLNTFHLQRELNNRREAPLTAILPGVALQELWQLVGVAEKALLAVSAAALLIGMTGMLAVFLAATQQRRHEIAVLRALGCPPCRVAQLLMLECLMLSLGGVLGGILLLQAGMALLQQPLLEQFGLLLYLGMLSPTQWQLCAVILTLGLASGLIPALLAWRMASASRLIRRY